MKGNIGHLEGASGLAGVIKTVLILERGIIPPNANFESLNPRIDASGWGLQVSSLESDVKRTSVPCERDTGPSRLTRYV